MVHAPTGLGLVSYLTSPYLPYLLVPCDQNASLAANPLQWAHEHRLLPRRCHLAIDTRRPPRKESVSSHPTLDSAAANDGAVGFAWTCRVMALLTLFCGVLAFFLLKTRLPPKPPGAFFYKEAFKNFEYVCVVANFWVRRAARL